MPKPKKNIDEKIVIRGRAFSKDSFKPHEYEECEIIGILDALEEIGIVANKGFKDIASLVNGSPLLHIEGLIRYQLEKHNIEGHGFTLDELETTSDFRHARWHIHNETNCIRTVFLFDFLSDIVWLSSSPAHIDQHELEKIAANLRALSFLVAPQINAANKPKDIAFEAFAYAVWQKMRKDGAERISAQAFWNHAVKGLSHEDRAGEFSFELAHKGEWGKNRTDTYAVRLELNKKNEQVIRSICESKDIPNGKAKTFGQIKNIWPSLQKNFIKNHK